MSANSAVSCGFLNILKPPGMSSAQVVGMARRLLGGEKVGHAGTLDPEAAGVLPLMVGKAARLFDYLQDKEKAYVAEIAFGSATDTQDAQGTVVQSGDHYPAQEDLLNALPRFLGTIWQRPPMYSALKQDGKRLYDLARQGQSVDVPAREVTVHALAVLGMTPRHGALLSVRCSKGFYVRTLCHDLGELLGCPAHMRFLLRTQSGAFGLDTAHTLEQLQEYAQAGRVFELLSPIESVLSHLPAAAVPEWLVKAFCNGGKLPWAAFGELHGTAAETGAAACLCLHGRLTAIGRREGDFLKLHTWLGE